MELSNKQFLVKNWGLIDYQAAWSEQDLLFQEINAIKLANKKLPPQEQQATPNYLIFCEHPPVYTLGRVGTKAHLLVDEQELQQKGIAFFNTNRGGDITYHGPGQLVVYPIIDLENFFMDVHLYLRLLENAVIATLHQFNLPSGILQGFTGVWLDPQHLQLARKICAIGIRISRWITMHGLALNVYTDLNYFNYIIPCGIQARKVTSMAAELGYQPVMQQVSDCLYKNLIQLFKSAPISL